MEEVDEVIQERDYDIRDKTEKKKIDLIGKILRI